jgi:hypothetical protein
VTWPHFGEAARAARSRSKSRVSGREAIIHVGAFDAPLGTTPDRHVQWASRAEWYVHGDALPVED